MKQRILLDTNVLLSNSDIIYKSPSKYAVCLTTLRELDKLKRQPELNFTARRAIKAIYHNLDKLHIDLNEPLDEKNLTNDEKIILSAKENKFKFQSEDIGAIVLAKKFFGVEVENKTKEENINYSYTGYIEKNIQDENVWKELKKPDIDKHILSKFGKELKPNQHYILYHKESKTEYIILRKTPANKIEVVPIKEYRILLRNINVKIKPLDAVQWVAFSNIVAPDVPLVVIEGKIGTGKTILAIIGALMRTKTLNGALYNDIYITRPPLPIDRRYELGFLPGSLDEKISPWLLGFKTNLSFIMNEFDEDKLDEMFRNTFKPASLEHIQGASVHNGIFIVDEYQFLEENMLKQTLSRIAEGSKIILVGDPDGQSYNINRGNEGFKVLWRHRENQKLLAYTKLENIYRSKLSEFVENIFATV